MTLQQLDYLITIAKCGSLSGAAKELYVSQSALSKSVKKLEEELEIQILERTQGGVSFTAEGLSFLRDAHELIHDAEKMKERYSAGKKKPHVLSVSSQHYFFVVMAFVRYMKEHEGDEYDLSLREEKTTDIIQNVFTHRSDLGFIYYYEVNKAAIFKELEHYNLEFTPICTAMPHAYISKNHPLAGEPSVTLQQLDSYPFLHYDYGTDPVNFAEEIFTSAHPTRSMCVTDRDSGFSIMRLTGAYSLGTGSLYEGVTPDEMISVPLDVTGGVFPSEMTIGWINTAGRALSAQANQFLRTCRQVLEEEGAKLGLKLV